MSSSPVNRFAQDTTLFPQCLDTAFDRVLLTRITDQEYRQASFLDQRILSGQRWRQWVSWQALEGATGSLAAGADFIFHIGHVGSTLISRLLGELDEVFALREPQLLRDFADVDAARAMPESPWPPELFQPRLEIALAWLSRCFDTRERALIKATSFVGEIAAPMLRSGGKALFLYVAPGRFIETILAGENSRLELAVMARSRLARLHKRLGRDHWKLWELTEAERIAMTWACEMTALESAAAAMDEGRVMWLDFDVFLDDPAGNMGEIAGFFGYDPGADRCAALTRGPIMQSYSKAPEHAYSPQLRAQVLAQARHHLRADIDQALGWLNGAGQRASMIDKALRRATG